MLQIAVGQATGLDGREAALHAVQQGLDRLGKAPVVFAWVVASQFFSASSVLAGLTEGLGNVPILGYSSSAELTRSGRHQRSVGVALLSSQHVQARAQWLPDFAPDSQACTQSMLKTLLPEQTEEGLLLVVAEGLRGDPAALCEALSQLPNPLAGCLAEENQSCKDTFQFGGQQAGSNGLAAALLEGEILMGVGAVHGWQPTGAIARITQVDGAWIRQFDGAPASEVYSRLFGYPASEWMRPPLNKLVRQYPLGIRDEAGWVVHAPLYMDADSSLRMQTSLPEGQIVEWLIGSQEACQEAARQATHQALEALGAHTPKFALMLVDTAWKTLFETQPGAEIRAVCEVLGGEVPVLGGYTLGQICRSAKDSAMQCLNQHIEVVLIGD